MMFFPALCFSVPLFKFSIENSTQTQAHFRYYLFTETILALICSCQYVVSHVGNQCHCYQPTTTGIMYRVSWVADSFSDQFQSDSLMADDNAHKHIRSLETNNLQTSQNFEFLGLTNNLNRSYGTTSDSILHSI